MNKIIIFALLFSLIVGCSSVKPTIKKNLKGTFQSTFYENQFTGFLVVNSQNSDTLLNFNGKKYFTPASNTKIFTLFASLEYLSDSIPALKYIARNDSLFIEGTGDPTLLHSSFQHNKTLNFLRDYRNIALHLNNFQDEKLGPGWAWEDYQYAFQAEKGAFPIYGNIATLKSRGEIDIIPSYFKDSISPPNLSRNRDLEENRFYFSSSQKDTLEVPFRTTNTLTCILLERALQKKVSLVQKMPPGEKTVLYSVPSDSVLKKMMHDSDNFLAEQLLLTIASTLSDTLSSTKVIELVLEKKLGDLQQEPRWVDGSGLSRYNLFTPESIVHVLNKMYKEIPRERLFDFFPAGGMGTLEEWYPGDSEPYLFAKTGSVGNNHNISGYLITKSGKTLIFSFMNNHFRRPSSEVKEKMQSIFEEIRDTY